jgi:hypothetical protein
MTMTSTTKKEIAKLHKMKLNVLQARFTEVTGETSRSPNKAYLIRRISEALEARTARAATPDPVDEIDTLLDSNVSNADNVEAPTAPADPNERLSKLDVETLRQRYVEVVGRATSSQSKNYLLWKIREAQKGRVPVGPRRNARQEGAEFKVLPLRMESEVVEALDAAWRRQGLRSRTELFRRALCAFLTAAGEAEVAARFAAEVQ